MLTGAKVMPGSIETDRRTRELAAVATDDTASGCGWTAGGCGGDRTGLLLGAKGNSHGIGNAVSGDGAAKACSPRLGCEPHRAAVAGSVTVLKPRRHERLRGMDEPSGAVVHDCEC